MYRQVVTMCIYNDLFQHNFYESLMGMVSIKSFIDIAFIRVLLLLLCALFLF